MPGLDKNSAERRRHATGEATRRALLEAAERLFALRGIDGVTLREIRVAAGQSNASAITYHFGSKTGLVRALIEYRRPAIETERRAALDLLRDEVSQRDPAIATARELVRAVVEPMASSIRRGEQYVPFLARLSEDPRARSDYWPTQPDDESSGDVTEQLLEAILGGLPPRVQRARVHQFHTSVLHVLADHARSGSPLGEARVSAYIDGWAHLLIAPVSPETRALLEGGSRTSTSPASAS